MLAGEHEVLLDDAARVVESARSSDTQASLLVGREMQHDWPLTLPWLEESRAVWTAMRRFIDERVVPVSATSVTALHSTPRRFLST